MRPIVTIGVCVKNGERTLYRAIQSVFAQDFRADQIEIIFVDDGSTDKTLEIARSIQKTGKIVTKIFTGSWQGLGKARNTVIQNASGVYIVWLDADETLEKNFLTKQLALIEKNPRVGILSAKMGIPSDESNILALELIPSVVESSRQTWEKEWKLPGTGGTLYRVEAAQQVGGFDEKIAAVGEDIEIALRIRNAGWLILRGNAVFYEHHNEVSTWSGLWRRVVHEGQHSRRLHNKTPGFFSLYRMNPLTSFLFSFFYLVYGYRFTKRKLALLMPFYFTFRMTGWFYGFSMKE